MPIITRKIKLQLCTEGLSDEERKGQWNLLYRINDNLYRSANNTSSKLYLDEHVSTLVYLKHKEYQTIKKELAKAEKQKNRDENAIAEKVSQLKSYELEMNNQELAICKYADEMSTHSVAYKFATELETNIYSQILTQIQEKVYQDFLNDQEEVREGKRSIRTYKKGMPIPFPWNKNIRMEYAKTDDDYEFYIKWYNGIRFHLFFGNDKSNNRLIVKRCFKLDEFCNDNYIMRTSSIKMVKGDKGTELYLLLVVDIPEEKHELNNNIVVGVDLGINVPVYVATNITEERKYFGDREHFFNTRMAFEKRFHSFQRLKGTAGGRGRTKKLQPLERLKNAEKNWVHTQNHYFSRDVIKFALQVKAATIQMEDLSGYGKDDEGNVIERKKFILGKWSYNELQNMITYKAKKVGMKVNMVNPAYTSQTCSCCGERDERNRNGTSFICHNPQCKQYNKDIHADYNAARNIAKSKNIVKNK